MKLIHKKLDHLLSDKDFVEKYFGLEVKSRRKHSCYIAGYSNFAPVVIVGYLHNRGISPRYAEHHYVIFKKYKSYGICIKTDLE